MVKQGNRWKNIGKMMTIMKNSKKKLKIWKPMEKHRKNNDNNEEH